VGVAGGAAELARAARPGAFLVLGSDLAGEEARAARPDVVLVACYRTLAPPSVEVPPGPVDVFFTSPSAVAHFRALAPHADVRRALCHGATTLRAAAGYSAVAVSLEQLLDATPAPSPSL